MTRIWRKMVHKMEEGFKEEQQARQQLQNEIAQGFKSKENARLSGYHEGRDQEYKDG